MFSLNQIVRFTSGWFSRKIFRVIILYSDFYFGFLEFFHFFLCIPIFLVLYFCSYLDLQGLFLKDKCLRIKIEIRLWENLPVTVIFFLVINMLYLLCSIIWFGLMYLFETFFTKSILFVIGPHFICIKETFHCTTYSIKLLLSVESNNFIEFEVNPFFVIYKLVE